MRGLSLLPVVLGECRLAGLVASFGLAGVRPLRLEGAHCG